MFVLGGLMQTFVSYYLWKAIFLNSPNASLAGFNVQNMIVYVFMTTVTTRFVSSDADRTVGLEVKDGSIAMNLIKPINYQVRILFDSLGGVIYNFIFVGLPIWIGLLAVRFFSCGELPPDIGTILLYLLSMLLSFTILFLFNFSFGLLTFYVTNLWGFRNLKNTLIAFLSGQLIPIAFFPKAVQNVLSFFPFSSMNYTPVMIYLKKFNQAQIFQALGVQVIWILILILITNLMWKWAINRLTILGG
jgi:ABC-2 type transport system permease protein